MLFSVAVKVCSKLREEHKPKMLKNWVLRKIFGIKGEEVTGEWRKLHNEKLNDLYFSPNITQVTKSRRSKCVGCQELMGERIWGTGFWHWELMGERIWGTGFWYWELMGERIWGTGFWYWELMGERIWGTGFWQCSIKECDHM